MTNSLRFMFFGDIVGQCGVSLFCKWAPKLKEKHRIDAIVVNGENAAKNGKGISEKIVSRLIEHGANMITSGNHIWQNKEIYEFLNKAGVLLRPANYPSDCPGSGCKIFDVKGIPVGMINLQGRGFMRDHIDCPFRKAESLLTYLQSKTKIVFIDFHAEATAEKQALAFFLDGKISGFYGTHTHVQTADEKISQKGTSYITDLGFCGAINSIIGMEHGIVIKKFLTQMPTRFKTENNPPFEMNGILVEVDVCTGKSLKIEKIKVIDNEQLD